MDNIKRIAISMKNQITKTPFERVLSEMTNEEDFFPNMSRLIELSEHSFNQMELNIMNSHIWKRLNPSEKNWRKLLKTLNLVEALLVFGNPECFDHFYEQIDGFKYCINYDFVEELTGTHGKSVREKAQLIVDLLKNKDILVEHRVNLKKLQEKVLLKLQNKAGANEDTKGATFIGETLENFKEGFINMKKDIAEFGSSIVTGIKHVVHSKSSAAEAQERENRLEIDEFKSIGSYDNYFNEKGSNLLDNDKYSTKQGLDKNLSKIEKSKSAVYRKDEIDLLNDDKENEEKEKIKDNQVFMSKPIKPLCKPGAVITKTNNKPEEIPKKIEKSDNTTDLIEL